MAIANMKIGARLGFGFAALLALQLVTTSIGLREMAALSDSVAVTGSAEARTGVGAPASGSPAAPSRTA